MTKSILAIDDSKAIRDMIAFTLKPAGFAVLEAGDGREGLDQLRRHPVDMVITDINMPNMNGLDFVAAARREAHGSGIPIVVLTTESKPEVKAQGKALGATGWMNKPFDADMLLSVVRKLVG